VVFNHFSRKMCERCGTRGRLWVHVAPNAAEKGDRLQLSADQRGCQCHEDQSEVLRQLLRWCDSPPSLPDLAAASQVANSSLLTPRVSLSGAERDPKDPSDCWLQCFFNTMLGNSTFGLLPMDNSPFKGAWADSFTQDDPKSGGCPVVNVSRPPYLA
jgi:hypothetical protein